MHSAALRGTFGGGALKVFIVLLICSVSFNLNEARPKNAKQKATTLEKKCGYESCHKTKPNMLNVHLIPHTHDDVGWLKTVTQYYYGSKSLIQKAGVQYILDSVVEQLLKDPEKRFIYVESAFFFKWWREQDPELQEQVKMLVNEGRLEFIGGAWSMNDEATTHYQSVIDQFTWGLRRLNDTFGECARPRVGWQIDPFGHSREMASMFAQMGFDGLFFGRLDYQDKSERLLTKTAEMIWRASANLDESAHLFTGALYNQYQPPPGFCFDILCADEPIIDSKHSPDYNVNRRVNDFLKFVDQQAKYYRTNNIIITMGGDFTFQDANVYFKNLDKLIRYTNARQENGSNVNLLYSTPSCYLKSLHDAGITWPTKDDDFFPYASDPHAYWTGYFTSRPTLKRYERLGNHFLQVCKQLTALAPKTAAHFNPHLSFLRESMGIMQHHDAVTGTEKQAVAGDYALRLEVAIRACATNTRAILNQLTADTDVARSVTESGNEGQRKPRWATSPKKEYKFQFETCTLLNISSCEVPEQADKFILTLYNPLAQTVFDYVRVPVPDVNYQVKDFDGVTIETQFLPVPAPIQDLNFRKSKAPYELVFPARDLPPLGYKSYYITKTNENHMIPVPDPENMSSFTSIGNEYIRLTFDTNGFLVTVTADGMTRIVNQEFVYYEGAVGNNREFRNRSSGAYIFRPATDQVRSISLQPKLKIYRGNLVEEVHQSFNDWISQVVRVYRQQPYAEFEWLVGPIPVDDNKGKEIISRFNSDINSGGIFYTDSNGREMIKRKRDHRDTWKLKLLEHTSGNYYPITTKIAIEDDTARMAILTDRAQGGSSMGDGSLELMVHRRLLHDDAFGVDEALNETAYGEGLVARGTHYLILGASKKKQSPTTQAIERITQLRKLLPAWSFFSNAENITYEDWRENCSNIFTGVGLELPANIHLMSYEPWRDNEVLVRFEHILEKDEDPELSKSVQFNVQSVLSSLKIADMRETTLAANAWLGDNQRLEFVPDEPEVSYNSYGVYHRSFDEQLLLRADKPLLGAKYYSETGTKEEEEDVEEEEEQLAMQTNRLKRVADESEELNRKRAEKLRRHKVVRQKLTEGVADDDNRFIVELSPMQMRTYILTLQKDN
ncbi:lysosomal alpha-mannosidase isoform X2 [Anastrepha obliqua]|uniref:lysosomal alpha-mannosidase isoform X2 n=1 Tax=Anastrepha obliqua TaxID=95512 RepID=UPI002408F7B4|nr:lysosomal alpha-mannosidase isoform X2 [Anastrepha obliqua]XP_054741909.1 lysosomal alpha-mannosidase isoform X2 [Anastrepha obliqua]